MIATAIVFKHVLVERIVTVAVLVAIGHHGLKTLGTKEALVIRIGFHISGLTGATDMRVETNDPC